MTIPTRKTLWSLLAIMFFFAAMQFSGLHHFDLDREANFPTWFSTQLLFSVALASFGIYALDRDRPGSRAFWLVMTGVYCFLSIDEASVLHEALQTPQVPWMIFYAPFAGAFFVYCAFHLIRDGNIELRNWILGGLLVYALGGLGGQAIAHYVHLPKVIGPLEAAIEECFEMGGTIIVLVGCLGELNRVVSLKVVALTG